MSHWYWIETQFGIFYSKGGCRSAIRIGWVRYYLYYCTLEPAGQLFFRLLFSQSSSVPGKNVGMLESAFLWPCLSLVHEIQKQLLGEKRKPSWVPRCRLYEISPPCQPCSGNLIVVMPWKTIAKEATRPRWFLCFPFFLSNSLQFFSCYPPLPTLNHVNVHSQRIDLQMSQRKFIFGSTEKVELKFDL